MKFRQHRGSLADSMKTVVELPDRAALLAHCRALLLPYQFEFPDAALHVERYGPDARSGWDSQSLVTIDGYGVMGMTDSAPDRK